jgi:hypothetical protein
MMTFSSNQDAAAIRLNFRDLKTYLDACTRLSDMDSVRTTILRDSAPLLAELGAAQLPADRIRLLGTYIKERFVYGFNSFVRLLFVPVVTDFQSSYVTPQHVTEAVSQVNPKSGFTINPKTKMARAFLEHFAFVKDFWLSSSEDANLFPHVKEILQFFQTYGRNPQHACIATFKNCHDRCPLFVAIKSAAVCVDRLKVAFKKLLGTQVSFLPDTYRPDETISEAFLRLSGMTESERQCEYPLSAIRAVSSVRMRERSRSFVAPPPSDFGPATRTMREHFEAELSLFGEQIRSEIRQYYAERPNRPVIDVPTALADLDARLEDERTALEQNLSAEIDEEVRKVAQQIEDERADLENELYELLVAIQMARLKREEAANLSKRKELLVLRSEIAQCRRSARDRQARLGERIAILRAHLVE